MKKALIFSLILSLLLSAAGCSLLNPAPKDFDVADYNMVITADEGFKEDTGGDWSLQITNYQTYISVMPFTYEELDDITPEEIYSLQNEDIFCSASVWLVYLKKFGKLDNWYFSLLLLCYCQF